MITLIIDQVIFILINVLMARWHAHLIEKNRPVRHGWWAAGYLVVITAFSWLSDYWLLIPPALFLRKLIFDPFLNHWRHQPINYMSAKPASIVDQFDRALFGRDWLKIMLAYFIALTVSEYFLINHFFTT